MNNKLKNGHFNVIATAEINYQDFKYGIPLEYLLNRLKRVRKNLNNPINSDTKQMALGFEDLRLNLVKPSESESSQKLILVQGLNAASVNLILDATQTNPSGLLEETNLAKAELTTVITESSKIAKKISVSPIDASQLENLIKQTQFPDKVRVMLGNMNGAKESVIIDEETLFIGGYSFPTYSADGEVQSFNNCEILKLVPEGKVIFDISRSNEFSLTDTREKSILVVDINRDTLDFSLLAFAFAAKLPLDIEVGYSTHSIKQYKKCSLVQILNRSYVSAEISRKWLEISQKLDIVG